MAALGGSIARRYARALFEIGASKKTHEAFAGELDALVATYQGSPELRQALGNPMFKASQQRGVLEALLPRVTSSQEVRNFALLLLERRRIAILPGIARAYHELLDEKLGRVRATITSAKALDAATLTGVQRAIERRLGKTVVMTAEVDPQLIGGIIARVGDLVFDGSVRTRLDGLRGKLLS